VGVYVLTNNQGIYAPLYFSLFLVQHANSKNLNSIAVRDWYINEGAPQPPKLSSQDKVFPAKFIQPKTYNLLIDNNYRMESQIHVPGYNA
jgi:hypothetical protein